MIVKFLTESGSEYEYDNAGPRLVRRVRGVRKPTPRQQQDGDWYECDGVSAWDGGPIRVGAPALIWWGNRRYAFIEGGYPSTLTSAVTEITESI